MKNAKRFAIVSAIALAIDGKVVASGRVLTVKQVEELIQSRR